MIVFISCHWQMSAQVSKLKFKHLDTSDGLSQSWVQHIGQDKLGYIWIGTADGLNRFDGYTFEPINVRGSNNQIEEKTINFYCMIERPNGELLFGTSSGLYRYEKNTNSLESCSQIPTLDVYSIAETSDALWIGSYNLFEYRYEGKELIEHFPSELNKGSLSNGMVYKVYVDSNQTLWIGTGNGLNIFNPHTALFTSIYQGIEPIGLTNGSVKSIIEDEWGRIWVGTDNGLNVIIKGSSNYEIRHFVHQDKSANSLIKGTIRSMLYSKGLLWIGAENGGLNVLQLGAVIPVEPYFENFKFDVSNPHGISNNSIYSIFEDNQSNVWLGTFSSGIDIYSPLENKFHLFQQQAYSDNTLINNHVNTFFEIDGDIWIGTEEGVSILDEGKESFQSEDTKLLTNKPVWSIYQDSHDQIWVGSWGGGLNLYNIKNGIIRTVTNEATVALKNDNVFAIYEDSHQNLWIGTMGGGILKFNYKDYSFTRYTNQNSNIATNFVEDVFETSRGELLIANVKGVLVYSFANNNFERLANLPNESLLNSDNINSIKEDGNGRLLIGAGSGLYVREKDETEFSVIGIKDGLANNSVKSIVVDNKNHVWLGTNKGISQVILTDSLDQIEIKNFSLSDGLQSNEFNRRSSLSSTSGLLYFGGANGFNTLNIDELSVNIKPNRTVLTDFKIRNKSVNVGPNSILKSHISEAAEITLNHDVNEFGFSYLGINYISTEKNQYAYMLKGFDKNWSYVGNRREVTYTNIDPGKYVFKVNSANNDGVWNRNPVEIKITILPPFYLTYWAYTVYAILVVVALYLFRRYSIIGIERKQNLLIESMERQKETEISKSKMAFFTNISHEIRTPLTLIDGPVQELIKVGDLSNSNRQKLELVNRNVRRLLHLINQLLDFRKIDTGHLKLHIGHHSIAPIVRAVSDVFMQQAKLQGIDFRIEMENEDAKGWVDEEKLTTILYNLISNAFKYIGNNDVVKVSFRAVGDNNGVLEIKVSDNGLGISEDNLESIFNRFYQVEDHTARIGSSGIGLNIVKDYVDRHHGDISVNSKLGEGSTFTILLPNDKKLYIAEELLENQKLSKDLNIAKILADSDVATVDINLSAIELVQIEGRSNILVVEDEKDLLKQLLFQLKEEYNLTFAVNGKEALEKAEKSSFDLVISDVMMPEMDGLELTRSLRNELITSHIPIIILTAKANEQNVIEGVEHGADVYLAKPYNIELLKVHIASLLSSREKLRKLFQRQIKLDSKNITITSLDEQFLDDLMRVVEKNMSESNFDMEMLSKEMAMSYRSLVRKVKSLTGQTSNEFLNSMRLKKAAYVLGENQLPVAQVSAMVGFNDPAYFSRCFQQKFGISPSKYAKSTPK